jgi:hypothetical protein
LNHDTKQAADAAASAQCPARLENGLTLENYYHVEIRDPQGNLIHEDRFSNLVTTAGLTDNITQYFKGSAYTAAFYVGLTSATPTVNAADTMSSHSGWTEVVAYSESVRQTLTLGSVSAGSASNTASKAVFTVNADGTAIGGAFLTTVSTKSGSTGTLYGVGAFSGGNVTLSSGSTISVTITVTAS